MITAFVYRQGRVWRTLLFTILGVVALYLRYRKSPVLTSEPELLLTANGDSSYYLRLFDLVVAGFPRMPPGVDYYSNYPGGLEHFLPPVWSYVLAATSIPLSMLSGLDHAQIAGVLMLVLGAATSIPIYFLARELFGKRAALPGACIALFNPYYVNLHFTGVDHHIADIFLVALVFALFLASIRHMRDGRVKLAILLAGLAGLLVAFSMLVSLSLVLIIGLVLLPVVVATFVLSEEELTPIFGVVSVIFGFAAMTLVLLFLATPWFSSSFESNRLSYLHIAIFAAVGVAGLAGRALLYLNLRPHIFRIIAATAIMSVLGIAYLYPAIHLTLTLGYLRSIGSYPLGVSTIELLPIFVQGLVFPVRNFTYLVFALPVIVAALVAKNWRDRMLSFKHIFFYVMLLVLGFYTLQAMYYSIYLSIFTVIAYGLGIGWLANVLTERLRAHRFNGLGDNVLVAIGLSLMLVFMTAEVMRQQPLLINPNLADLADYIDSDTVAGGDFHNPNKKPSHAIMCNWSHAYQFQYLSRRATIPSGNHDTGTDGIIASAKFYQATSEEEALDVINALNGKYVVAHEKFSIWEGDIERIGEAASSPASIARVLNLEKTDVSKFANRMAVRLFWEPLVGMAPGNPPLHHFRLLHISDNSKTTSPFMLYEVVKGAHIVLEDAPNKTVALGTNINFNNGMSIIWRLEGRTDSQGLFTTVVPYSTRGGDSPTYADPYRIKVGDKDIKSFDVEESAVVNGSNVILNNTNEK